MSHRCYLAPITKHLSSSFFRLFLVQSPAALQFSSSVRPQFIHDHPPPLPLTLTRHNNAEKDRFLTWSLLLVFSSFPRFLIHILLSPCVQSADQELFLLQLYTNTSCTGIHRVNTAYLYIHSFYFYDTLSEPFSHSSCPLFFSPSH